MVNLADLPNAGPLSGAETLPMQQGAGAVKVTVNFLFSRAAGQVLPISGSIAGNPARVDNTSTATVATAGFDFYSMVSGTLTLLGGIFTTGGAWNYGTVKPRETVVSGLRGVFVGSGNGEPIRFAVSPDDAVTGGAVTAELTSSSFLLGGNRAALAARIAIGYAGGGVQYGVTFKPETDATSAIVFVNASGDTVGSVTQNASSTAYNTSSDYRLPWKKGHVPLTGSGEFVDALNPRFFPEVGHAGFIAHEFGEVSASSVTGEKDAVDKGGNPIFQQMDASSPDVMANVIAELQSLRQRVAALEGAA